MQEDSGDNAFHRWIEEGGLQEELEAVEGITIEKELSTFLVEEVVKFFLGDRDMEGNVFREQNPTTNATTVAILARGEGRDKLICFQEREDVLDVSRRKVVDIAPDDDGVIHVRMVGDNAAAGFHKSSIEKVSLGIETDSSGGKSRFVQFDLKDFVSDSLRIFDDGRDFLYEGTKPNWPF